MLDSPAMAEKAHAIVKRLPEDVGWLCEPLLEVEPGRRLLALNPALAVAMSLRAGTGENWQRRLDEYLALRARDLAGRLGFGGTRRALRTLAKLEPESVTVPVLRLLTLLLEDDREKWLFHLPALNTASIEILAVPRRRGIVTFAFLVELCRDLDAAMCDMIVVTLDDICIQRLSLTLSGFMPASTRFRRSWPRTTTSGTAGCGGSCSFHFPFTRHPSFKCPRSFVAAFGSSRSATWLRSARTARDRGIV